MSKASSPAISRSTARPWREILLGEIKRWNDAAIRKLNPNTKLPSQAILVVRRSDGSGTTFAFTDYLAKVSAGLEVQDRVDGGGGMADRHRRQRQ